MKAYYWSLTDRLHVGSSGHSFILSWQQFWHNYVFLSLVSSHAAMQHIETKFWLRFGQLPAQWFDTVGQWGAVISIFSSGDTTCGQISYAHNWLYMHFWTRSQLECWGYPTTAGGYVTLEYLTHDHIPWQCTSQTSSQVHCTFPKGQEIQWATIEAWQQQ